MYHDQGLPVLKHAGFEHAVNVTLGLPYPHVRSTTAPRSISPAAAAPIRRSLIAAIDDLRAASPQRAARRDDEARRCRAMPSGFAHRAKKRFGQHFLHERGVLDSIVQAIDAAAGRRVVEIGPGEGALTLPLLDALGALTAIEFDRDLMPRAARAPRSASASSTHRPRRRAERRLQRAGARRRPAAHRRQPALQHVLADPVPLRSSMSTAIRDMHFMLQKEVVERMAAAPGSKVYGRLSRDAAAVCRVEPLFDVPPGAFRPAAEGGSAVVRLVPRAARAASASTTGTRFARDRARRIRPAAQDAAQCARRRRRQPRRSPRPASIRARAPNSCRVADFVRWPRSAA